MLVKLLHNLIYESKFYHNTKGSFTKSRVLTSSSNALGIVVTITAPGLIIQKKEVGFVSRYVGVASVQRCAFVGDTEANISEMEAFIEGVVLQAPFIDIIMFPEACVHGFVSPELAEPIPGPSVKRFQYKAKEVKNS